MRFLAVVFCIVLLSLPAAALELEAPAVPEPGREWMPSSTDSFSIGLAELMKKALGALRPDLQEACRISLGIFAAVLMVSVLQSCSVPIRRVSETAAIAASASMLLMNANSMIRLASDTILEMAEYGKLLLPVMTAALAAQGSITTSGAIYAGTAMFHALLQNAMGSVLVPGVYLYLALRTGSGATGEDLLKQMADLLKNGMGWVLKILLMVFTTYLSLTRVISGTTDAAALKAAKVTMSSFIPVVGGILSDASEAVLLSAGLMKNAAGIYGILAVLALFVHPFLRLGVHYLILKFTAALCGIFGGKQICSVLDGFSTALGLLLGMTAAQCMMLLISTVCFMKGVG